MQRYVIFTVNIVSSKWSSVSKFIFVMLMGPYLFIYYIPPLNLTLIIYYIWYIGDFVFWYIRDYVTFLIRFFYLFLLIIKNNFNCKLQFWGTVHFVKANFGNQGSLFWELYCKYMSKQNIGFYIFIYITLYIIIYISIMRFQILCLAHCLIRMLIFQNMLH